MGLFTRSSKGGSSLSDTEEFELKMRKREDADRKERSELNKRKFAQTKTAKLGNFMQGFAKQRRRQLQFAQEVQRPMYGQVRKRYGKRGRPVGSYASKYASVGGVYEYRRRLNAELRANRMQQLRDSAINPQQQQILAQIEQRRRMQLMSKESQIIPDTEGIFDLRSFDKEIDEYSNLV